MSFAGLNYLDALPACHLLRIVSIPFFLEVFQTIDQSRLTTGGDTLTTPVRQGLPLPAPRLSVDYAFRFQVKGFRTAYQLWASQTFYSLSPHSTPVHV